MKNLTRRSLMAFCIFLLAVMQSCKKTATYDSPSLEEYMPLSAGKYIRYRLDSTRFIFFGQKDTLISYQAKDVVDAPITDNRGRQGWRIIRYLRDTNGITPWKPAGAYMVIPTRESIEVVDNNLRFVKLKLPVLEGYSWKGNAYIDTYSLESDVRYLDGWDYTYAALSMPFNTGKGMTFENTVTINQRDEVLGTPSDLGFYSQKNYSVEVYAKGVGLVYQNFLHWEYQPPDGSKPGYKEGYGLKLTLIDHN